MKTFHNTRTKARTRRYVYTWLYSKHLARLLVVSFSIFLNLGDVLGDRRSSGGRWPRFLGRPPSFFLPDLPSASFRLNSRSLLWGRVESRTLCLPLPLRSSYTRRKGRLACFLCLFSECNTLSVRVYTISEHEEALRTWCNSCR